MFARIAFDLSRLSTLRSPLACRFGSGRSSVGPVHFSIGHRGRRARERVRDRRREPAPPTWSSEYPLGYPKRARSLKLTAGTTLAFG